MKRLLVVDDEHCIRRMLRQVLREHEVQGLPLFTKPLERSFARAVREWMGDDEAG